jgi:hypothetical protein
MFLICAVRAACVHPSGAPARNRRSSPRCRQG